MNIGRILGNSTTCGKVTIALVLTTFVFYSFLNKSDSVSVVDKTLFEHKITNPVLREQIERFDSVYGNDTAVKRNKIRGISITYSKNSGYYPDDWVFNFFLIGYTDEINSMQPLIMCEPINGKPVVFKINDLLDYIEIPRRKSMEFLKESSPKEYDSLIELGALRDINTGSFQFSFVQWMVIFDHNLLINGW